MKFTMKVDVKSDYVRILQDNPDRNQYEVILILDADEAVELGTHLVNAGWPLLKSQRNK